MARKLGRHFTHDTRAIKPQHGNGHHTLRCIKGRYAFSNHNTEVLKLRQRCLQPAKFGSLSFDVDDPREIPRQLTHP